MRGGLDDALDKLARRDELRRRAAGEAAGTPLAVQELVEAIAGVVGRHPRLEVTVGVEGAGDPTLLHFFVEDGVVQVNADNAVAQRATPTENGSPRHADFDLDPDEPVEEPYVVPEPEAYPAAGSGSDTRRLRYEDPGPGYADEAYDATPHYEEPSNGAPAENPYLHPFAATPPPPVPPQNPNPVRAEQHRAPAEPAAAERGTPAEPARGMPAPLPEPIPLRVDSEETEMAAKRLAALLRDNPTLLRQAPPD
ncbi:hypothetical protein [Jidongwangia harbinensis]|uniref:hypothetical protein n=1 Tax=Jidongwangia harbinensis TaxID=2878561 RepID=UPI001CDA075B|nr:hypothetical protein [Jidongwangia harbinensis]MCA2215762.1 hypothetical protein [Jidongwangia harbinensis]